LDLALHRDGTAYDRLCTHFNKKPTFLTARLMWQLDKNQVFHRFAVALGLTHQAIASRIEQWGNALSPYGECDFHAT
jgi:hypothetical protein